MSFAAFIPHTRLLSGGVGPGQETLVEGEGLWLTDDGGGEVGVGRVDEVIALAHYDDNTWDLEHGASLVPDPIVAYALQVGRSRVGTPSIGQHGAVQVLYEGVVEAGRDERVGGEEARLLQMDQDLEHG